LSTSEPSGFVGDLEALTALNRDYIHSVQHGDVQRFDEILAEDFLYDGFPPQLGKSRQVLRMDTAKARAADKLHALEAGGRVARAEKGFNTRPLQGYHQNTHGR
jgi:hypothetical protein